MSRPPVDVRRAGTVDVTDLVMLWTQAREESGGTTRALTGTTPEVLRGRLQGAVDSSDIHLLIARWEGRPAGYAVLRIAPLMPIVDDASLHVENLYVAPELRRHGIAKALLAGVATVAERHGAEQVVISAPPGARDAHRFLARLGFTPLVVRRMASTAALRRRLAGETRRGGLEDLLSRRRSLRARTVSTPAAGFTHADTEAVSREGVAARLRTQALRARRIDLDLLSDDHGDEASVRVDPAVPAAVNARTVNDTLELPIIVAD